MRILVTGGGGFIGSHVCDRLLTGGHEPIVIDAFDEQVHGGVRPDYLNSEVEVIEADVRDRVALGKTLDRVEAVIHLAAAVGVGQSMYEIERYCSANVIGTAVLLEEVVNRRDRIKKVVVASSMSIYGEGQYRSTKSSELFFPALRPAHQLANRHWEHLDPTGGPLDPEPTSESKPLAPTSVYAVTKRDQEELVLSTGAAYEIPSVALRFFNVFGERQSLSNPYTGVVAIFSSRLLNGQPPVIFEDGHQSRDFIDVRDVARAVVMATLEVGADGQAINIGTGIATSINGVLEILQEGLGSNLAPRITGQSRAGDIRHCFADARLARDLLGFQAEIDLKQGFGDLLEWLREVPVPKDGVELAHQALVARGLTQ